MTFPSHKQNVRKGRKNRIAVYQAIRDYKLTHYGGSPTIRELMARTGIASSSHVKQILGRVQQQGLIRMPKDSRSRSIYLPGEDYVLPPEQVVE